MNGPNPEEQRQGRVPRYYANSIAINGASMDLSVSFGFATTDGEPPEWLAQVVMSWEEAFLLRGFLAAAIEHYEQHAGPIRDLRPKTEQKEEVEADGANAT